MLPTTATATPLTPEPQSKDTTDNVSEQKVYEPTDEQRKKIANVRDKRMKFRRFRLPHEQQWFVNSAMLRGQQYVEWSVRDQKLTVPPAPPHRIRLSLNRIRPKIKARRAKFTKTRTKIEVYAASPDLKAKMDARATKKALDYIWRKDYLEKKKRQAIMHAEVSCKGFWWFYWDPNVIGRVQTQDPVTGQDQLQEALLGDVRVEVGSAYEVLVGMPGSATLAEQPELLRVKLRPIEEVKGRYPEYAQFITADTSQDDLFRYERQISTLNASGFGGYGLVEVRDRGNAGKMPDDFTGKNMVLVTEHFEAPTPQYPKGRYSVLVGDVLVKEQDELPYGFYDLSNPYPCVEFVDDPAPNQFWSTTLIEQIIPLQREYNLSRSKLAEHIRMSAHPKLIVWKQNRLPKGAWSSEAGEIIELIAAPGLPPPMVINPPPIANDLWQNLSLVTKEFDDISQVYPAAEGNTGGAKSGFQTNLLQEATDAVHQPDLNAIHGSLEEACIKIRRIMKQGYTVPRIIQSIGKNLEPEIEEFEASQIDEFADIIIEGSNALPDNKAVRMNMIKEMFEGGLLGNPQDPATSRKALSLMELGGADDAIDDSKIDENQANVENNAFEDGKPVAPPEFFQNHQIHYQTHANLLKSPETSKWPQPQRLAVISHIVAHLDHFNPQAALEAAQQYKLQPPPNAQNFAMQQQMQQQMMQHQQQMNDAMQRMKLQQEQDLHFQRLQHEQDNHQMGLQQKAAQTQMMLSGMMPVPVQAPSTSSQGQNNNE